MAIAPPNTSIEHTIFSKEQHPAAKQAALLHSDLVSVTGGNSLLFFPKVITNATGSGWQSWAQEYLEQGTIADRLIENMEPNTEYLVYAYGVDPITIERLTPISKKTLTTLAPQTIDTKFDIQIVSTEGLNIDVLVKANDYDGHFVAKIYGSVDAADTDATVLEKISESWIDNVQIYGWMGYTAEMILSQYTFQQSREIQETLEPNSKYYIYAFAVDDEALRCSDIVFIPITTNDTSIQH